MFVQRKIDITSIHLHFLFQNQKKHSIYEQINKFSIFLFPKIEQNLYSGSIRTHTNAITPVRFDIMNVA